MFNKEIYKTKTIFNLMETKRSHDQFTPVTQNV